METFNASESAQISSLQTDILSNLCFYGISIQRITIEWNSSSLYSADGYDTHLKSKIEQSYDFGGLKTNNRRDDAATSPTSPPNTLTKKTSPSFSSTVGSLNPSNPISNSIKESHNIFPGDLYPFLRKPLFLIIDSNNSIAFQNMPNLFGQPFISLLSADKITGRFSR